MLDEAAGAGRSSHLVTAEGNATESSNVLPREAIVQSLLRDCLGSGIQLQHLSVVKEGMRCVLLRAAIQGGPLDVGSVMLKRIKPEQEPRGLIDGASLAFLTSIDAARDVAPRFYGRSIEHGLFAMQDLGDAPTLDTLLRGADPGAARLALRALAAVTGRMHAETIGREQEFRRRLDALPVAARSDLGQEVARWQAGAKQAVEEWSQAARCRPPRDFEGLRSRLSAAIAGSGQWRTFTHGDPAPTNCLVRGETVYLLDFEFGGFRHALYDLTAWYVLCPLPEKIVEEMNDCYRNELVRHCAAARDEWAYRRAWAMLCAFRALALLSWIPRSVLDRDQPRIEEWTARQAVLCTLDRLTRVAVICPETEPLAEWGHELGDKLRARWPEATDVLPAWPALSSYRGHHES